MLTKNKKKLTARQRAVLSFLIRFLDERGYPPTVREIALHFGLKGPRSPKKRLDALRLQPSNPNMKPIIVGMGEGRVTIVGKVIGIFRKVM